jgi:hypothetical protein
MPGVERFTLAGVRQRRRPQRSKQLSEIPISTAAAVEVGVRQARSGLVGPRDLFLVGPPQPVRLLPWRAPCRARAPIA